MVSCVDIFKQVWALRSLLFTFGGILGALPILFLIDDETMPENARRCFYILVIMALLWVTEALPITVTSLFPLVMFPLAEVMPAKAVSGFYVNDTTMLFFGGLLVAAAVEEWNLHRRIAILILKGVGSDPKWLLLGLMLPTWFLSMWISNTATASMMVPIANAIIHQTKNIQKRKSPYLDTSVPIPMAVTKEEVTKSHTDNINDHKTADRNETETAIRGTGVPESANHLQATPKFKGCGGRSQRMTIAFTLCVAYAANIGGIATLTGTPPNLVMRGIADDFYRSYQVASKSNDTSGSGITFANWMTLALPLSFLTVILAWLLLVLVFMTGRGCCTSNPAQHAAIKNVVDKEWTGLGKMTLAEIETLIIFVFLIVLWISRDPKESPGWVTWFKTGYVSDSVSSMLMGILLFILPAKCPNVFCWRRPKIETLIIFVFLIVLWISRDPKESPGWVTWFKTGYVSDSVSSMLMGILLFILPAKCPNVFCWRRPTQSKEPLYTPILTWQKAQEKIPWGVLLLLGGGFALANGCKESGLSRWLGDQLAAMDHLDTWVFNMVICAIVAVFTEVTSNTATATLLMPILADLGVALKINPLYLMASAAIATSFAFMLPVATPPNAIVFSYGQIKIINMASVGFIMNVIAVGTVTLCVNTWGKQIFDFDHFDPIFNSTLPVTSN